MDYRSEKDREPDLDREGHNHGPPIHTQNTSHESADTSWNDATPPDVEKTHRLPSGEETYEDGHDNDIGSRSSRFSERDTEGIAHVDSIRRSNTSLSRVPSRKLEKVQTGASTALSVIRSRAPRPPFSHPLSHQKTTASVLVDFEGKADPYRPMNWPFRKKCITTILYGFTAMCATFATSVYSPAVNEIASEFHIGQETAILGISLLLVGFGIGPLLWAPLSEVYGRRLAAMVPFFISAMFAFGGGAAKDVQTLMICRFFQGFFGSSPVTNSGGVLGDIWPPELRGAALVGYALAIVGGPAFGPIVGSAFIVSGCGWRWTQYLTGIMTMVNLVADVLILDESYAPVLLVYKARRLRHQTGNWALHAAHEEWDVSLAELGHKYLVRPFQLLTTPICFFMALYASFCYGIFYASLAAFPVEFEEIRGWNQLVGSLPFLAMLVGVCLGSVGNVLNQRFYVKRWKANDCRAVPEARLPPMMFGSIFFCAGLFMFAWSSGKSTPWIVPCIGIALEGMGFFTIFQAALNYLIDCFQKYAASAVAANTALRSGFAAAFPLFITPQLHAMGVPWGISVYAFIAAAMIPIPYVFYVFGKAIRGRNAWSRESL